MKASRFSEAQKAFILKQVMTGYPWRIFAAGRHQPCDLLQLEKEV